MQRYEQSGVSMLCCQGSEKKKIVGAWRNRQTHRT